MSYILEALKKLDKEKNYRHSGVINISGELLKGENETKSQGLSAGRVAAIVVVVALVTAGSMYALFKPTSQSTPSTAKPLPPAAPSATTVAAQPAPPLPSPAAVPVDHTEQMAAPTAPASPATPKKKTKPSPPDQKSAAPDPSEPPKAAAKPAQHKPDIIPPPANIKVSGIAWQDERSLRRVVVNGMLAQEGTVIAGAKITDISQEKVRFTMGDKVFEIPLVAPGIPAGSGK